MSVPDGFGTAAEQVPKTKTKTKYLNLTFRGGWVSKNLWERKQAIVT